MSQEFSSLDISPISCSGQDLITKTLVWLVLWWLLALLLFVILTLIGDTVTNVLVANNASFVWNPLFPLLLLIVVFVIVFLGTTTLAVIYSAFYKEHRSTSKRVRSLLITNIILFLIMAPIYMIFNDNLDTMFFVIGLHVTFAVFIAVLQWDIIANPHYALSHVIGAVTGIGLTMLCFGLVFSMTLHASIQDKVYMFLLFPPIFSFTCVPLAKSFRQIIYYKMYEWGNDILYTSSPSDRASLDALDDQESDEDEIVSIDDL